MVVGDRACSMHCVSIDSVGDEAVKKTFSLMRRLSKSMRARSDLTQEHADHSPPTISCRSG